MATYKSVRAPSKMIALNVESCAPNTINAAVEFSIHGTYCTIGWDDVVPLITQLQKLKEKHESRYFSKASPYGDVVYVYKGKETNGWSAQFSSKTSQADADKYVTEKNAEL